MLKMAVLALMGAVSAVGVAQAVSSFQTSSETPQLRAAIAVAPQVAQGSPASIAKASDGHYWAEADVNGARVRFLVDTGASAVALTLADAKRLGIATDKLSYSYRVMTAAGEARAAQVTLGKVSVAGTQLRDVEALVIDKGLDSSLLGMTYLGRLASFEATRTSLILRP